MPQKVILSVPGGTTHVVTIDQVSRLQTIVVGLGAENYPVFVRLGAIRSIQYQPVTARGLLAEVELFMPALQGLQIPGVRFDGAEGEEIGGFFGGGEPTVIAENDDLQLSVTTDGIRLLLRQFPPPVGFRSHPGLKSGWFDCYFESLHQEADQVTGVRTPAMGGSGAPVLLPRLPLLPPVTQWHYARISGKAKVTGLRFTQTPAEEVFRDLTHAVTAACTDSLRLREPLQIRTE